MIITDEGDETERTAGFFIFGLCIGDTLRLDLQVNGKLYQLLSLLLQPERCVPATPHRVLLHLPSVMLASSPPQHVKMPQTLLAALSPVAPLVINMKASAALYLAATLTFHQHSLQDLFLVATLAPN